ncbi:hypothetical protein CO610_07320 [Lysobacteraceae bacterium NML95-0200]|nr:hypothetical protein CO610_07320 [Xanthomonadaceae bacterium NML95-0200]
MNVIPFPSAQARSVMAAVKARAKAMHTQPSDCQEAIRQAMHAMASGHSPARAVSIAWRHLKAA